MFEKSALFNRTARTIALSAALAALTACTSTQTSDGSNARPDDSDSDNTPSVSRTGWDINHEGWAELGYQWEWTGYPPLAAGAGIHHATAYDDLLTFIGSGSTLSVLEASTGKVRWSRQLDRATTRFVEPVRRDGTLFAASDTELWEIDLRNGNTIDRDSLGTLVNTSPLMMGNLAIFGTLSGELFAYQIENDFKLWSYKFDGPIHQPAVKVGDNLIAAISENGEIRTLGATNAHTSMSTRVAGGSDTALMTDYVGLYVASLDQSIYAFDVNDGYRFWRIRSSAPVTVQHTLHEGMLYASTRDQGLMAIDNATGEVVWNNTEIGGWVLTVVNDAELIVYSGFEILAIDKERGDIITRTPISNIAGVRTDSISDGNIYVITLDGGVAKFGLR
ncbi:MAG: outer membrane protein assembly factor BamB family protein [Phycisphaerales bacterium]